MALTLNGTQYFMPNRRYLNYNSYWRDDLNDNGPTIPATWEASPSDLRPRAAKRRKELDIKAPRVLALGGRVNDDSAQEALTGKFCAINKKARMQKYITPQLARLLDDFVREFKTPEEFAYVKELSSNLVNYLTKKLLSDAAGSNTTAYTPLVLGSHTNSGQRKLTINTISWAEVARTLLEYTTY